MTTFLMMLAVIIFSAGNSIGSPTIEKEIVGAEFELPPLEGGAVMMISCGGCNITIRGIIGITSLAIEIEGEEGFPVNITLLETAG